MRTRILALALVGLATVFLLSGGGFSRHGSAPPPQGTIAPPRLAMEGQPGKPQGMLIYDIYLHRFSNQ